MKDFDEIYFAKQRIRWGIDLSLLKDGVYNGGIKATEDITEFRGFKEEMGLEINEVKGNLSFYYCEKLTNVGVLPDIVECLSFYKCINLESIDKLPKEVKRLYFTNEFPLLYTDWWLDYYKSLNPSYENIRWLIRECPKAKEYFENHLENPK